MFDLKNVRFNNDIRHPAEFQVVGDGVTLDESEALRCRSIVEAATQRIDLPLSSAVRKE